MAEGFTTIYSPGPAWEAGKKLEEQAGFPEQLRWWKSLAKDGRLKMTGILAERPDVVVVAVYGADAAEVDALVASTPWVLSGRMRAATTPGEPRPCGPPRG